MVVSCQLNVCGQFRNICEMIILDCCLLLEKNSVMFLDLLVGSCVFDYFCNEGDVFYIQKSQFEKFKSVFFDQVEDCVFVYYLVGKKQKSVVFVFCRIVIDEVEKWVVLFELENYILFQLIVVYGEVELFLYFSCVFYEEMLDGMWVE